MSTIGNGINGVLQASSKGKAAQGKTADSSHKGDFARTVANLHGKSGDGDGGRKGGRISISETGHTRVKTEQVTDTTRKAGPEDLAALADALQGASVASDAKQEKTGFEEKAVPQADDNRQPVLLKQVDDKHQPVLQKHADGQGANKETVQEGQPGETRRDAKPGDDVRTASKFKATDEPRTVEDHGKAVDPSIVLENVKGAKNLDLPKDIKNLENADGAKDIGQDGSSSTTTDVGNLLEMLAAPAPVLQAVANGAVTQATAAQVAASGVMQDVKVQLGETALPKAEMQDGVKADGQASSKTDAALLVDPVDAGDVPESSTDQLFRLIRADGKGRDLDMSISGTGERTSVRDASQTTAAKIETVTVLDSRRYIGLAQTGNAGAVTTAIAQDPNWAASLSATSGLSHSEAAVTGKVVNTLKIQMKPIDLGMVTATLRLHGDALVVSLQVETAEAYRQLSDDQDAIVKALRGHGFAVDQVSVQLSPIDRSTGTQQQQGDGQTPQQQQFSSQPQAREGGNGRQGGNGDDTRTFAGEGTSHDGNTSENASGLAGGQPVRSGGVYL